jgi:hypothetical protein
MKKAVIVTPFDNYSYNVRIKYLEKYLEEQGYESTVISADFDHRNKVRYDAKRDNLELLHVPEYRRNLSFSRIYSHYVFAKLVYKRLKEIEPELVYGSAPPNFLFQFISRYKKNKPSSKLIFEIGDMWPETLPLSNKIKNILFLPLGIWARLRNQNLKYADYVIYECELFRQSIQKYHPKVKSETIYLAKQDFYKSEEVHYYDSKEFNVAYVGSINNIVDIDGIMKILIKMSEIRDVVFHIIGDGESKNRLISDCDVHGIQYIDHGVVYDDTKKREILEKCQFGLNIMKSTVMVGATMKSLEYFHWGLILINNIPADTKMIIDEHKCGFNLSVFDDNEMNSLKNKLSVLGDNDIKRMRMESRAVYHQLFDETRIHTQYTKLLLALKR